MQEALEGSEIRRFQTLLPPIDYVSSGVKVKISCSMLSKSGFDFKKHFSKNREAEAAEAHLKGGKF